MSKSDEKTAKSEKRPVGRPRKTDDGLAKIAKNKSFSQKLDELKLGKFADCEAMALPEKTPRRGWQIVRAVLLMAGAILGICLLFLTPPLNYLFNPGPQSFLSYVHTTHFYWNLAAVALIIMIVCCMAASIALFAGRRVPVVLWCILIVAVLTVVVSFSFHKFARYEQRECYKNYPHIIDLDYACPSVVNELSMITAVDLGILVIAVVLIWLVRRSANYRREKTRKS